MAAAAVVETREVLMARVSSSVSHLIDYSALSTSIETLLALITQQSAQLAAQDARLGELEGARASQAQLEERVEVLERELAARDARLQQFELANQERDDTLRALQQRMDKMAGELEHKADQATVLSLIQRMGDAEKATADVQARVSSLETEMRRLADLGQFIDKEMVGRLRQLEELVRSKADHEKMINELHSLALNREAIDDKLAGFAHRIEKQQSLCQSLSADLLNKADRADIQRLQRSLDNKATSAELEQVRASIRFVDNIAKIQGMVELKAEKSDLAALEALLKSGQKSIAEHTKALSGHSSQLVKLAEALRDCANVAAVERLQKALRSLEERGAGLDKDGLITLMARIESKADQEALMRLEEFISQHFTEENGLVVARVRMNCLTCDRQAITMRSQPPRKDEASAVGTPAQITGAPYPPYAYDDFNSDGRQYQLFGSDGRVYKARQAGDVGVEVYDISSTTEQRVQISKSAQVYSRPAGNRPSSARPPSASGSSGAGQINLAQHARQRPQSAPLRRKER